MSGSKGIPESYERDGDGPSAFDEALAQSYIGRTIVVGLTYLDHKGELVEQRQLHGTISAASRDGIVIALGGKHAGEDWTMPPDLENIRSAPPGEYRFRETGEVVVNPDLMATWTIAAPAE